jgi:hypothetical protein
MSALNWLLTDDIVLIATDTLASGVDLTPRSFGSKVFPLPHLRGVICGTGSREVVLGWYQLVSSQVLAQDIVFLDSIAPVHIKAISQRFTEYIGTSTVYHFGFHPTEKRMCGFAYRSEKEFASERLGLGMGVKPPHRDLISRFEEVVAGSRSLPTAFVDLIRQQRLRDDAEPIGKRVGIGGEVHLLEITPSKQSAWTAWRFEDFDEMFAEMLKRLSDENESHLSNEGMSRGQES